MSFGRNSRALALALLLAAASLGAPLAADPMTLEDVGRLETVTRAVVSPDGTYIAYVLSMPRDPLGGDDGPAWAELHVIDADGVHRPFITGEVNVEQVGWSPDSSRISYVAKRSEDEEAVSALYWIARDGGESQKLAELGQGIEEYSFHPDGERVVVLAKPEEPEARKELKEKGYSQEVVEEEWQAVEAWVVEIDGEGDPSRLEVEGSLSEVHWSPTGEHIAVAVAPTPLIDDRYMKRRIRVVDATSGEVVGRVENPGKLGEISWSQDGRRLAYISAIDVHDPRDGRLMVASASGGAARDVMPGYEGHFEQVAWTPAGEIVYLASQGVEKLIGRVEPDGSGGRELADRSAAWSGLSLSASGEVAALVGETPAHPAELFRWRAGGDLERLTDSNPWLAERDLGEQEVVRYEARDGLALEGLLIHPIERAEGERVPLVMVVHGGPESHFSNGWLTGYSRPGHVLAGRGLATFYPNYRGSTGRGVAFSKSSQGDPAGKEFDDLVDGIDHLVERGLVDADRVGITGGSYGGYATAWGATYYSDRYAAAVMFVGISNEISKFGTSDIPNELMLVHSLAWPWEDWQASLERSPIYHIDKARTPLLILHGKDDPRVFRGQSMELYRFLKVRDQAPVRLVFYPGEGHGNTRAASRYDYSLRSLRWMEHYLKGTGGDPPPHELDYGFPAEESDDQSDGSDDDGVADE